MPLIPAISCALAMLVQAAPVHPAPHPDLYLTIVRNGEGVLRPWEDLVVHATIENRSTSHSYAVVMPGDGSGIWREPFVKLTGELDRGDGLVRMPEGDPVGVIGCGNVDWDWSDEVVVLAPGGSVSFSSGLNLGPAHAARIHLQYEYRATPPRHPWPSIGASRLIPPELANVAPFSMRSNVLEIAASRGSLDMAAVPRQDAPLGRASDALRLDWRPTTGALGATPEDEPPVAIELSAAFTRRSGGPRVLNAVLSWPRSGDLLQGRCVQLTGDPAWRDELDRVLPLAVDVAIETGEVFVTAVLRGPGSGRVYASLRIE